jgi:hypothetical protein
LDVVPVNLVDPSGHNPLLIAAGIGLFALGGIGGHLAAKSAGYEVGSWQWYASVGLGGTFAVASAGLGYAGYGLGALVVGIVGDTLVDRFVLGYDIGSALAWNALINIGGDFAGAIAGAYLKRAARDAGQELVTRFRVTGIQRDADAMLSGVLESHAQRAGIPRNRLNQSLLTRVLHTNVGSRFRIRPTKYVFHSQFVSVTSSRKFAEHFTKHGGIGFEFKIRKADLIFPWYNLHFYEFEDLVRGGTEIFDVQRVIA